LVVARRVFDHLTPGWQQIGAVWLPLPHLIDLLPAQVNFFYRTGLFASLVSIACLAISTGAAARLILRTTGSAAGACICAALLVLNPNLLYLHTTPMTEPLLLAMTALAVLWLVEWVESNRDTVPPRLAAVLFAAMWTRYEAWPVIAAAVTAAAYATWRRGGSFATLVRRGGRLAIWPALAVWWGTHRLSGYFIEAVALAGAGAIAWRALARKEDSSLMVTLALFATAAVPIVAFYDGHPYRIRYMIPLVAACALFCGFAVGMIGGVRRVRKDPPYDRSRPGPFGPGAIVAVILLASLFVESPPWNLQAPMLVEAQWDRGASIGRRDVTACLARDYTGDKVLASMGSL